MNELDLHKTRYLNKDYLFFACLVILAVIIGVSAPLFLPDRFYNDAFILTVDLYNEIGWWSSYPLTIAFYKYTGLKFLPYALVGFLQLSILFYALYKIGVPSGFRKLTAKNGVVWLSFLLLAIYVSMPSKEFINFLFVAVIPIIFLKKIKSNSIFILCCLLWFILFGSIYRLYYLMIPILSVLFYVVSRIRLKNKLVFTFFIGLFAAIFMSLSYGFISGSYLSEISRDRVNDERLFSTEASSKIEPPFEVDSWYGEAASITYGFFTVNFPVNGLRFLLKPQILAFVVWQLILILLLLWGYANCLRKQKQYPRMLWIFHFTMAYFIIQGVFEPDLGSAVKHKMGFLPLIYIALYYDYFRKNIPV